MFQILASLPMSITKLGLLMHQEPMRRTMRSRSQSTLY